MSNLKASSLFNVDGMVFVVTGGGTGIGAMMARALDANGAAKVYIVGRRMEKLQQVVQQAINRSVVPIQGDVTSKESLTAVVERVKSEIDFVNVVIANSGTMGPTLDNLPKDHTPSLSELQAFLWDVSMADFTETFLINTTGMFYTLLAFLQLLNAGNKNEKSPTVATGVKSQFIATNSIGAYSRRPGAGFSYAGSKAGAVHIMKQVSTYLMPYDIRANVIAPGIYPSVMSEFALGGKDGTKEGAVPDTMIPAKRCGTEEDMAGVTLFLCSRAGAYCNGNVLITDGGRLSITPATY